MHKKETQSRSQVPRRAKKTEQFVRAGSYSYSSNLIGDMIESARALMLSAVGRDHASLANLANHASPFAPAALVLGVIAFELFLNHLIVGSIGLSDPDIQDGLDKKSVGKVDFLTNIFGTSCRSRSDLDLLVEVRNEIAHHFARPGRSAKNLPPWYLDIERRGLFITTGREDDFDLGQKLGSYKLAYWGNRVVVDTVADMLRGSSHPVAQMNPFETSNFPNLLHGVPIP